MIDLLITTIIIILLTHWTWPLCSLVLRLFLVEEISLGMRLRLALASVVYSLLIVLCNVGTWSGLSQSTCVKYQFGTFIMNSTNTHIYHTLSQQGVFVKDNIM